MEVAKIQVGGTCACAYEKKTIRAGMVGVTVSFAFDEYWDGLNKIAVYRCGGVVRDEYLEGDTGTIPAEVLTKSGFDLEIGVYGTDAEKQIAIPTCWANLGAVRPGADPSGDPAADPSLPIWAQILAKLGNLADLSTEAKENLVAAINEVLTKGGGEVDPEEIGRIVDKHLEKNPPAAYTLPIATETTLGGVKAAAATEEMTQPVCITEDGKLVTAPGQNSGGNADQGASWTTEQINLLDRLFNYIPWIDSGAGAIADSLIASLRGGSSGGEEPDTPVEPDEPNEPEVTLTSISAVYSGGDVAVGTALTYLTGIVVTAHYSDGTSKAVTGYTLSGTIAEGSNTITVSYEGKTATFTVTGVAESGGDAGETKTLTMTRNGTNPGASVWYNEDGTEYSLTKNGFFYKSNAVADADCEVTIKFTAEVTNADIVYYIGQIKREDRLAVYFAEQLGTASTEESVKTYTLHEGYELVIAVNNQSPVSTEVTCADGSFTDVTEFYTNLVGGYTLDAYLKSSDGSIAANWSQQNASDLIDVSAVASVYIMTVASDGFTMQQFELTYAFYDSSETFISGGNSPESTDEITPVAVPDGAKYMRVGGSRGNTKHGVYVGTNPAPYRYEFVAFA